MKYNSTILVERLNMELLRKQRDWLLSQYPNRDVDEADGLLRLLEYMLEAPEIDRQPIK